jgi:DNA mismatch repair protein MutS
MAKKTKETPLMKQYNSIKAKYPDALLLFRVGDFYETFSDDAVKTANILDIVLTKRGAGSTSETHLAGFPHHALNTYLPKLVKAGLRVAICDQLEDPKTTKTIVKRGVTELVTPGVSLNDEVLQSKSNNFLAAIHYGKKQIGLAFLDVSTGEYLTSQGDLARADKLMQTFSPKEVLIQKQFKKQFQEELGSKYYEYYLEDWVFQNDFAYELLTKHFKINSLKGFGIEDLKEGIVASGAVLHYLSETQHHNIQHLTKIARIEQDQYVWMDRFTMRNLELFHSHTPEGVTLLDVLDKTLSPMGGRLLKRWLSLPLKDIEHIKKRQEVVKHFLSHDTDFEKIKSQIKQVSDLERLVSKVATSRVSPREMMMLKNSLEAIIPIKKVAIESDTLALKSVGDQFHSLDLLREKIGEMLHPEAPVNVAKGNVIKEGYSKELDELRNLSQSGKTYLDDMLQRESERTQIPSLKIAFNNVFGYYIEVRNTHKDKVPDDWTRKQTLVNAERYITEELKEYESKILGAEEKIGQLETQLFQELVTFVQDYIQPIQQNAQLVAQLDALGGFAQNAIQNNYVRPHLDTSKSIDIKGGRHPVIEKQLPISEPFIANDVHLDPEQLQIIMITGPNMSGKSAILRQTALIVLMAQIGSYVPAEQVALGIVDKIFVRVGASDNISMGESTFMVEMNETANILNNITDRSLILLDEIGRGTSTYDGISIAWAIAEYLHEHPARAKTLFATHYHELNDMTHTFERVKNFNVSVKELKDKVIFLRKLVPGGSEHSFGIYVAELAGMPTPVVHKAKKILKRLEEMHTDKEVKEELNKSAQEEMQLSFFQLDDPLLTDIKEEILNTNIDALTPIEALMKLNEIKRMILGKK